MASVLGLAKETVENIARETGVGMANLNSPGQIVISGLLDNINNAAQMARREGASCVITLDVSGPFHSQYMREAGDRLQKELDGMRFSIPKIPVVANVTARYYDDVEDNIKRNLVLQVSNPVLWEDSIRLLIKDGIITFLEIGPGTVLKGLLRRIDSNAKVYNIGKAKEVEEFCKEIASQRRDVSRGK